MSKPPLWKVMCDAYCAATDSSAKDLDVIASGSAAEICALRDWLKARLPEGGAWYVLLTAEAARAERGEVQP